MSKSSERKSVLHLTKEFITLSNIAELINEEIQDIYYSSNHHPLSLSIVRASCVYQKLPLFIMLKTRLRWSDIKSFPLKSACKDEHFNVIQHKTKKHFSINFLIFNSTLRQYLLNIDDFHHLLSYNAVKNRMQFIKRKFFYDMNFDFKSETHLFRHLDASFFSEQGKSLEFIAGHLGNSPTVVKDFYIHDL